MVCCHACSPEICFGRWQGQLPSVTVSLRASQATVSVANLFLPVLKCAFEQMSEFTNFSIHQVQIASFSTIMCSFDRRNQNRRRYEIIERDPLRKSSSGGSSNPLKSLRKLAEMSALISRRNPGVGFSDQSRRSRTFNSADREVIDGISRAKLKK
jgi:hypothetical protein